jgi:hypothetical protein
MFSSGSVGNEESEASVDEIVAAGALEIPKSPQPFNKSPDLRGVSISMDSGGCCHNRIEAMLSRQFSVFLAVSRPLGIWQEIAQNHLPGAPDASLFGPGRNAPTGMDS